MITNPLISVVMAFYNAELYIDESIQSILNQSFRNFELILINDGSTDKSIQLVKNYNDERIRLINSTHDYIASLNLGMDYSRGKYIARMDADDMMHPDRLFVQYCVMERMAEIDIVSSWCTLFNDKTKKTSIFKKSSGRINDPLVSLLDCNLFTHSSMILRTDFVRKAHLKYCNYPYAEDYKICLEAAKMGAKFYIEPQSLLYYRCHEKQVSVEKRIEQEKTSNLIKEEIMSYLLPKIPNELQNLYKCLCNIESMKLSMPAYKYEQMYKLLKYNCIKL